MSAISLPDPPLDSISSLNFSPSQINGSTYLVSSSWANDVRCWKIQNEGTVQLTKSKCLNSSILCASWHSFEPKVFTGSCDNSVLMWSLENDGLVRIGSHCAPVKTVHHVFTSKYSCVMSCGWDKKILYWDPRQKNPIYAHDLPGKCYSSSVYKSTAIVTGEGRFILKYNLDERPQKEYEIESLLIGQHRCVSIFGEGSRPIGFAIGGTQGQVSINYFDDKKSDENFRFKCHRKLNADSDLEEIFPVNDISFNNKNSTFATVGSDGKYFFWDRKQKIKLSEGDYASMPLSCCAIDSSGNWFAYAKSYDWSKGHEFNSRKYVDEIFLMNISTKF